ncbi:MAG: OadG family protein [Prevotellaceae bacterium]|jgi:sodium pump decarboxylase gamma subunit|nr:OadG family protein [Prevotellaceae bacterium]
MKRIKYIVCFFLLSFIVGNAIAQTKSDLKLNEILVVNDEDYQDDFGKHSSWIEVFNNSYGTVDVGGCFLTTDLSNPKMYPIQKNDVLTAIAPRQHVIFWADGKPTRGTFHLNFTLDTAKFIALISSDGRTIIDSITFPKQSADISYGRLIDGVGEWGYLEKTTPSTNNFLPELDAANIRFKEHDPWGVAMTLTAMSVVFVALILLYLFFRTIGKMAIRFSKTKVEHHEIAQKEDMPKVKKGHTSGEVFAAIAYAIHQYQQDLQDIESTVLTINKVARTYSPWSSKIYGLRETPNKR